MPLVERNFVCPCCGYPKLDAPPYENMGPPPWLDHGAPPYLRRYGVPSYECCACCGFEFGFDDDPGEWCAANSFAEYLDSWIAEGCKWFTPTSKPDGWSLDDQLSRAGIQR